MSTTLAMKNVKVRAFGTTTTVQNNSITLLMYYLNCIATVIGVDGPWLTDYQNYDELSGEELVPVYAMAKESNPLIFIKARIFIVVQKLLINSTNQFYEITDETIGFNANREIMIGGKIRTIRKSIACNNRWLSENYYTAIKELDDIVRRKENRE